MNGKKLPLNRVMFWKASYICQEMLGIFHNLPYFEFYFKQCAMNILSWCFPPSSVFFCLGILHTGANWGGDSFESNSLSFYEVINSVRYTLYFHNISDQKKKKKET